MKKIYLLLFLPVVAVMALSCDRKNRDEAIAVGDNYMTAFMMVNVPEMAKYSAPNIAEDFLKHYREDSTGHHHKLREAFTKKVNKFTLDKHETDIKRDMAELVYMVSAEGEKMMWAKVELDMMKVEGQWMITDIDIDYPND